VYGSTCPNGHAVEKGSSFSHHQLKADKASIIKATGIIESEAVPVKGDKATIASQKHSNLHLGTLG